MRPLLHIGYHKTGTTWLQRQVFSNAEAGFSFVARPPALRSAFVVVDPFDFEPQIVRKNFEPKIWEAQEKDLVPVLSFERLSGSPYAGGYDSRPIADRLAAAFPDARIMLVIREQTRMLVSTYKQYIRKGGAASFRQYITMPTGAGRMPVFRFEFLEYHRLIGYYQRLFGPEDVLVLPYELLEGGPKAFLQRIGEFAGVPATRAEFRRQNVSPSALALSIKRHANRWIVRDAFNPAPLFAFDGANEALMRLSRKVDARLPAALGARYERRWRRFAEEQVGDRYAKSNALTEKFTGLDLRPFGYAC